jgi:hypothetical protein
MKLHKLPLTLLLVATTLAAPIAHADQVAVDAQAVFPDAETFSVSFEWDMVASQIVPNSMLFSSSGPIGPFTLFSAGQGSPLPGFVWINSPSGDEFEILFGVLGGTGKRFPDLGAYPTVMMDFSCPTFSPPCLGTPSRMINVDSGSLALSAVPEPPNLFLLSCGLLSLLGFGLRRKRLRETLWNPSISQPHDHPQTASPVGEACPVSQHSFSPSKQDCQCAGTRQR